MTDTNTPLLRLIAKIPMLRTVQLADRLDIALDEVDAQLRPHLVAGTLVEHEVAGPNNLPAMAYEVSEQFKLTEAYRIATGANGGAPAVAAAPAPEAKSAQAPKPLPAAAPMTKVERAIALVTVLGSVSDADLHAELGLKKGDSVSSYIAAAKRDGRLVKDGNTWTLGSGVAVTAEPAAPPSTPAPAPVVEPVATKSVAPSEVPRFIFAPGVVLHAPELPVVAAPAPKSITPGVEQPKPAAPFPGVDMDRVGTGVQALAPRDRCSTEVMTSTPGFRCAVWSDGVVHLERRGEPTFELSPVEQDKLFAFLQLRA